LAIVVGIDWWCDSLPSIGKCCWRNQLSLIAVCCWFFTYKMKKLTILVNFCQSKNCSSSG
jgi:hypothetical protein